jgi:hypothetical protein
VRVLAVLGLALALAGCGGGGDGHGTATLWVTRDRGAHVVYAGAVPAGLDAIQVVERRLKLTTRYGGRYVQSIDGVSGSLSAQHDWFYFVDGIEGDRSAAEVLVHPGDVVWWDYRRWTPATEEIPAVVGAYPQPFLGHGTTTVSAPQPAVARALAREVHGVVGSTTPTRNRIVVDPRLPPATARIRPSGSGYTLELGSVIATRLAGDPTALRYRFAS